MVAISKDPKVRALDRFTATPPLITRQRLKQRMTAEVAERTTFTDFLPQNEVAERLRGADVLVQPSLTEACPLPVAEAMACGKPVVGSRVGGIPELVADGVTGILAESANPECLPLPLGESCQIPHCEWRWVAAEGSVPSTCSPGTVSLNR